MTAAPTIQEQGLGELQVISYAILKEAAKTVTVNAKHSTLAVKHYRLLHSLGNLAKDTESLLKLLHTPSMIAVLEQASPEDVSKSARLMLEAVTNSAVQMERIRSTNMGFWKKPYTHRLDRIDTLNREVKTHAEALSQDGLAVLLLTPNDQDHLLESLLNPPQPNDALRRSISRR